MNETNPFPCNLKTLIELQQKSSKNWIPNQVWDDIVRLL